MHDAHSVFELLKRSHGISKAARSPTHLFTQKRASRESRNGMNKDYSRTPSVQLFIWTGTYLSPVADTTNWFLPPRFGTVGGVDIWRTPHTLALIDLAIEEDLGRGDITSLITIDPDVPATADFVSRQDLVVAGLAMAQAVFHRVAPEVTFEALASDGDAVRRSRRLARVHGPARAVLAAERTALNFLQRLSAVATLTSRYVAAAAGGTARVVDTRKTTPGYRSLEKYAVRCGGGGNHRADLGSGILIKDNHLAAAGSLAKAVAHAKAKAPHLMKVEVEVDSLDQLAEALEAGADIVLLDNFLSPQIIEAVAMRNMRSSHVLLEVSGGVTLDRIAELSKTGVDLISVGALTHSALSVDIGLDFVD